MMSVNDKMTSMADNIRHLIGIQKSLTLDEMASRIQTERDNVDAAIELLVSKGSTQPENGSSFDLIEMINQLGIPSLKVETGTFTAGGYNHTVEHSLGVVPIFAIATIRSTVTASNSNVLIASIGVLGKGNWNAYYQYSTSARSLKCVSSSAQMTDAAGIGVRNATDAEVTFGGSSSSSYAALTSNQTYNYIVGGLVQEEAST